MTTCKLNIFLIRMAAEDAAQEAVAEELNRQIKAQFPGKNVCVIHTRLDMKIVEPYNVTVDGMTVEWTNESIG